MGFFGKLGGALKSAATAPMRASNAINRSVGLPAPSFGMGPKKPPVGIGPSPMGQQRGLGQGVAGAMGGMMGPMQQPGMPPMQQGADMGLQPMPMPQQEVPPAQPPQQMQPQAPQQQPMGPSNKMMQMMQGRGGMRRMM